MTMINVTKYYTDAQLPVRATEHSACWDIHACLMDDVRVDSYSGYNEYMARRVENASLEVFPSERVLIPTGLIFDIPEGWSMRIHPRSGLSFKKGIALSNCEGVIDADYHLQTFVSVINVSDMTYRISHGERIAQLELVPVHEIQFQLSGSANTPKGTRSGGFGSTGLT